VAQLVSVARADPTKPPATARGRVLSLTLGPVSRPVLAVAALSLGGVLVLHAWQADRAHRYRLAAFRAMQRAKVPDIDQAVTYLEAAARLSPDDADLRSDLGQAYLDRGQEERERLLARLRHWDQVGLVVGATSPQSAIAGISAWKEVPRPGRTRLSRERLQDVFEDSVLPGLRHFAVARRLCPLLPRPHMRFAAHAPELVRADKPEVYWERALRLAPFDPDLQFFAGQQWLRVGRVDDAWKAWRESLNLTPKPKYDHQRQKRGDRLSAIVAAVTRQVGSDPRRRADVLLTQVLPDRPDDLVDAARLLDPALARNGPARPLLDRALDQLADRPEGLPAEDAYLKAQVQEALGDDDAAIRAYKQALSFVSARPEWRYQFVKLLMAKGRWKEALAELASLRKQMPDNQQIKDWIDEANRELEIQ
jgi:Flp pilus assembly protein TadD